MCICLHKTKCICIQTHKENSIFFPKRLGSCRKVNYFVTSSHYCVTVHSTARAVSTDTRLRDEKPKNRGLILKGKIKLCLLQRVLETTERGALPRSVRLTIHLYLVPRLRMSGAIPPLILNDFMARKGKLPHVLFTVYLAMLKSSED